MKILSVNVGRPRTIELEGRAVRTSIHKTPVRAAVAIGPRGLEGDSRVAARKLGDEHHAVSAYAREHYETWSRGRAPYPFGAFGENLTIEGLLERDVRIGDVFACGTAVLQVAQPRLPCRKWAGVLGLPSSRPILESRRVGLYLRVLEPGVVSAGARFERLQSDPEGPSVDDFVRVSQLDYWDAGALERLLSARDLMPAWQEILRDKLERARGADGWLGFRELEVAAREQECEDVVSLWLRCPLGRPLPPFRGGQLVMLAVRPEPSLPLLRRVYFLSDASLGSVAYRISVRRASVVDRERSIGLVSSFIHDALGVGTRVRVAAPRGHFTLDRVAPDASRLLVVSAGIGIAAMLALAQEAARDRPELELALVHVAPDRAHHPFRDAVERLVASHPRARVRALYEHERGPLTEQDLAPCVDAATEVFLCGAPGFAGETERLVRALGASRVHVERFDDGRVGVEPDRCGGP
ncbi:MAG: MOSC domain-containing protein [Sandaracinaceae bacterium]|nr:MOSC domain-containing protein [Sandaracinaceae bacterium]